MGIVKMSKAWWQAVIQQAAEGTVKKKKKEVIIQQITADLPAGQIAMIQQALIVHKQIWLG